MSSRVIAAPGRVGLASPALSALRLWMTGALLLGAVAARADEPRAVGLAAFRAGHWADARAAFVSALERAPDDPVIAFNLGSACFQLAAYDDAEASYLRAAQLTHDASLAALALLDAGLAADAAGRHDAAAAHWRAAADRGEPAIADRASSLLAELARDALEARRAHAITSARSGREQLRAGDPSSAVTTLYGALNEARAAALPAADRDEIAYALAHALHAAHRDVEATGVLGALVTAHPDDADFHYLHGLVRNALGDSTGAATAFRAALSLTGLDPADAARAREWLAELTEVPAAAAHTSRLTVESAVGGGYDSNYASGREVIFQRGNKDAFVTQNGAPEIDFVVEPRVRVAGDRQSGVHAGARIDGVLYLASDADPFSLIDTSLFVDGTWAPRQWLTLAASISGYLDTEGVRSFGLYQTGAVGLVKATLWESEDTATRVKYSHAFIRSLDPSYDYLSGNRDELSIAQMVFVGSWRIALGYTFRHEAVGVDLESGAQVLPTQLDTVLRCFANFHTECLTTDEKLQPGADVHYSIPWSYDGHELALDGDGALPWGFELEAGARWQHRDYVNPVVITPTPIFAGATTPLFHALRVDDRFLFDAQLKRRVAWGISCRLGLALWLSYSNVDNSSHTSPFDYDDKNFTRWIATLDLLRDF